MRARVASRGALIMVPADGRLRLEQLVRLAAEFDRLSTEEGGTAYPAGGFVAWVRREAEYRSTSAAERQQPRRPTRRIVAPSRFTAGVATGGSNGR